MEQSKTRDELRILGEEAIRRLGYQLARLLKKERASFDIVLACGNTGIYMAKLVAFAFELMEMKTPENVSLPIKRFKNAEAERWYNMNQVEALKGKVQRDPLKELPEIYFDNKVLVPSVKEKFGYIFSKFDYYS